MKMHEVLQITVVLQFSRNMYHSGPKVVGGQTMLTMSFQCNPTSSELSQEAESNVNTSELCAVMASFGIKSFRVNGANISLRFVGRNPACLDINVLMLHMPT